MDALTYEQLYQAYMEAVDTAYEYEWEIEELKRELDFYTKAFDELQAELSEYR